MSSSSSSSSMEGICFYFEGFSTTINAPSSNFLGGVQWWKGCTGCCPGAYPNGYVTFYPNAGLDACYGPSQFGMYLWFADGGQAGNGTGPFTSYYTAIGHNYVGSISASGSHDVNGCYCKTGNHFNGKPTYTNGNTILFHTTDNRWALGFEASNTTSLLYASDVGATDPTNGGNIWNTYLGATASYVTNDCPSSSSSMSQSTSTSSNSSSSEGKINFIEYSYSNSGCLEDAHCLIPKPTNLAVGDFMLAHVMQTVCGDVYPPAGWTYINSTCFGVGNTRSHYTCYKFADADDVLETTFHFGLAAPLAYNIGAISTFRNVDTDNPIGASSVKANNTASTADPSTSITQPTIDNMIVYLGSAYGMVNFTNWAIPNSDPGLITRYGNEIEQCTYTSIGMACQNRGPTTATGNGSVLLDSSVTSASTLLALQPYGTTQSSVSDSSTSQSSSSVSESSSSSSVSESSWSISSSSSSESSSSSQSISSSSSSLDYSESSSSSISSLGYSTSSSSESEFNLVGYLCVEINGSNTKNHYIELDSFTTMGYTPSDRDFWGDIVALPGNLAEAGYLSMIINGNTYWLKVYMGDPASSCCTNLEGTWRAK